MATAATYYRSLPLTLLGGLMLSACTSQQAPQMKAGEKSSPTSYARSAGA